MGIEYFDMENKPENWPSNAIECQLENINIQVEKFKENPSYQNKEVLISLVSDHDLNQRSHRGLHRTTDYEVTLINSLFLFALVFNISALKTYLYELVGEKTRMQKIISMFPGVKQSIEIKEFLYLMPQLKLYHIVYQNFTIDNDMTFANKLIETIENYIEYSKANDSDESYQQTLTYIACYYLTLINDISNFSCIKRTGIWAFSRDEIYRVFELAGILCRLNGDNPIERPLKGVLMTSISNYVLKSRNDYNEDYICKYISREVAKISIENHEIWMSKTENLNDEREQKVIPELFDEDGWNNHSWAKDLDFQANRKYYVSSFCKSLDDADMKRDYGSCIYGYKDDRMSDILSPIRYISRNDGSKAPFFSQVVAFDVLYDREAAKEEINFLCDILECFDMNDIDRKSFLEEILQYWILSVKDKEWSHERERRYVLFMYDDYDYNEVDLTDVRFLKLKTSLFIQPDFILGDNPVKGYLKRMVDNKRSVISMNDYLFCRDCLSRDFDSVAGGKMVTGKCLICGSENVSLEAPIKKRPYSERFSER